MNLPNHPTETVVLVVASDGTIVAAGGSAMTFLGIPSNQLIGLDLESTLGLSTDATWPPDGPAHRTRVETTLPPPAPPLAVTVGVVRLAPDDSLAVVIGPAASTELESSRTSNQALMASNRQLEAFASVAAHDLQEPLRKVRAFTDRVRGLMDTDTDRAHDYLERVDASAARMQILISDLLTLARVAGRTPERQLVALGELVEQVLVDLADQIAESGAEIGLRSLPTLTADPNQFRQLFINLISNSLKYRHPDRPPQVSIVAERHPDRHVITVTDNGIGFDDQYLPKIFEPFERLWGRDDYPGTGVGLALCREIVRRHGGEIDAHGRPGQGAEFVITLPVSDT